MSEPNNADRTDSFYSDDSALEAGLAAGFGAPASVLRALESEPTELTRILLPEPDSDPSSPVVLPASEEMPAGTGPADKYQLAGEIARGGMGCVLKGRDVDLGRDVAVKVLLEQHAGRTELRRRFVEEAQIAGQLQHPGIVPVYELGRMGGRPFFSMKLVRGQTLARLLADRADYRQDLAQLLRLFEQACQAVAYAHSRGVIHRDLKPSNVMVGAFGEVLVMDWGLAKVLRGGGPSRLPEAGWADREVRPHDTQDGSILGTPAYIAPEQARGESDRIDERADVFGLGAILCEVLTGAPPFTGKSSEALRQARTARLEEALARLGSCGADAELIDLCRRCLAAEPGQRPRDAGAVVRELGAYLRSVAERLRQAELERAAAEARLREEARRRRVSLALAASVVALVLLGGSAAGWWYANRLETTQVVEAALAEARQHQKAGRWPEARAALERAAGRLGAGGPAALRRLVDQARKDARMVADLEDARLREAGLRNNAFDKLAAHGRYRDAFRGHGIDLDRLDAGDIAGHLRASEVREELLVGVDALARLWAEGPERQKMLAAAEAADDNAWRRRLRSAWGQGKVQELASLARDRELEQAAPSLVALVGEVLQQAGLVRDAERVLRQGQRKYPGDFWLNHHLAALLAAQPGRWAEAEAFYRAALALRPGSPGTWLNFANLLGRLGKTDEAVACYRQTLALEPNYAAAHNNLALAFRQQGKRAEAIECLRQALALEPRLPQAHDNLGLVLLDQGKQEEAVACFRRAIALDPTYPSAHTHLAGVLSRQGKQQEAVASFNQAIRLNPADAKVHKNLGLALQKQGRLDEAVACFRRAIAVDPRDAGAHGQLGHVLSAQGKLEEAIACYRKAITLDPRLAAAHHGLARALYQKGKTAEALLAFRQAVAVAPDFAAAHDDLGNALFEQGNLKEAEAAHREAIRLKPDSALAHQNLGNALAEQGRVREAEACYRQAIRLDPRLANAYNGLGTLLARQGKSTEAVASFRQALRLAPRFALAHCNLAHVLTEQGRLGEALAAYQKGHELGSNQPGWNYPSGEWIRRTRRLIEREKKLPDVLAGRARPAGAAEWLEYARLCQLKKRHADAAELFVRGFAAQPARAADLEAGDRYSGACAAVLAGKENPRWRRQALTWLRADLAAMRRALPRSPRAVAAALKHWQQDPDLAGLREAEALGRLPQEERAACERLWADVAALLGKTAK